MDNIICMDNMIIFIFYRTGSKTLKRRMYIKNYEQRGFQGNIIKFLRIFNFENLSDVRKNV